MRRRSFLIFAVSSALLAPLTAPAAQSDAVILILGDSLSAGYGLNAGEGWVALLQQRLRSEGLPYQVVNASISGDTSSGGLARLGPALQRHQPELVLIELGANDGLRGLPLKALRQNLADMIAQCRDAGAEPLLFEMRIPSNYGPAYTEPFTRTFAEIGAETQTPVIPFFLEAFALDATYFQADRVHPNARAQPLMLEAVWQVLRPRLQAPAPAP